MIATLVRVLLICAIPAVVISALFGTPAPLLLLMALAAVLAIVALLGDVWQRTH